MTDGQETPEEYPKRPSPEIISCPHVGPSGGCDDCIINEDILNCMDELGATE